ncbi:interleukin-6-like [Polymixia lowei]
MTPSVHAFLLSAVMLGGFVLRGNGGPVGTMTTGSSGETSGDELETERPSELLSACWIFKPFIGVTKLHKKQESCLQRVVQGLLKYMVLLKHVEEEYPSNTILPDARSYGDLLIRQMHPERATEMSATQEENLLEELDNNDTFQRKITAHGVLRKLHQFLIDIERNLIENKLCK